MNLFQVALLATTVSIANTGPNLTHVGQSFLVPVRVDGWNNPTGQGAKSLEFNVLPSQGLDIRFDQSQLIGPWILSINPSNYFSIHGGYVDGFHVISAVVVPNPNCIVADSGVVVSLRITVNQYWYGGHETLRLGKSVKELTPEPKIIDCVNAVVPLTYGNKTCVMPPAVLGVGPPAPVAEVAWYDVAGRKLSAKPTGSGVYFRGPQKKVVVIR